LTADIKKAYHLDELKDKILKSISSAKEVEGLIKSGKSKVKTRMKSSLKETTTAKGTLAEILGERGTAAAIYKLKEKFP
jgi:hypothetical protein